MADIIKEYLECKEKIKKSVQEAGSIRLVAEEIGITRRTLFSIVSGEHFPSRKTMEKINAYYKRKEYEKNYCTTSTSNLLKQIKELKKNASY